MDGYLLLSIIFLAVVGLASMAICIPYIALYINIQKEKQE